MSKHVFFLTILIILSKLNSAQNAAAQLTKIKDVMSKVLANKFDAGGPGYCVLIAKNDEIIYQKASGMADIESGSAISSQHIFRIASLTKQFTAASILQLLEQGKLKLDDSITRYLPDYPNGGTITILNLLSHTAGIKNITELETGNGCIPESSIGVEDLIKCFKDIPLDFAPGSDFHYSNSGYILLGYIIEKVSGQSYEEYIMEHIFKPLGMRSSFFDHPNNIVKKRVRGYDYTNDTSKIWKNTNYIDPAGAYSAGGLMMSIQDLYKWHRELFKYRVVKRENLDNAITPIILSGGEKVNYGLGFGLDPLDGSKTVQHSGSINGFSTFEIYLPEEHVYVAFFCNAGNKNVMGVSTLAASIIAGKANVQEIFLTEKASRKYVGTYQYPENGRNVLIFAKSGKLFFQDRRFSKDPWEMHFRKKNDFILYEAFPNNYIFELDSAGNVSGLNIRIADMSLTLKKVK